VTFSASSSSSSELRFQVVSRSSSADRWTPIGVGPERSAELAERRIALFQANGSELEYALVVVSADPEERAAQLRRFAERSAPAAPAAPAEPAAPAAPAAPATRLRSFSFSVLGFSVGVAVAISAPAAPAAQLERFQGTSKGWLPVGALRSESGAARLLSLAQRINPAATYRLRSAERS
jgi:hypothetical protein